MLRALYRMQRRRSPAAGEAGFTMVEMVIAIFLFALVITGVGVGMSSALNLTRQDRNRSIAANLAAQQMDTVRSTDFTTLDQMTQLTQPTTVTPAPTVEGVPYTMTQYTRWIPKNATGATAGPCQSPPTAANPLAYIAVTTTVSWNDMRGVLPVQSSTVISPPVGVYDQTEGHIRVTVMDASGAPISGAIVTISNPSAGVSDTATTQSDGCAFFAYEPAGIYTVSLSSGVGKVDGQGSATPVQTATVKSASTTAVQFLYDTASTLVVTFNQTVSGYTIPAGVPVSLGNTHLLPTGVLSFSGGGSPLTIPSLFPYSDGYQSWAGSCSDADPEGVNSSGAPYYAGATRGSAVALAPGGTGYSDVTLPSLRLQYKRSSGSSTYLITAKHATGDSGCPAGETYTLAAAQSITTSTVAVVASLPFGTWTITWKNNSSSATGSQVVNLSPLNANNPLTVSVVTVT